jgi:hypothetical protein
MEMETKGANNRSWASTHQISDVIGNFSEGAEAWLVSGQE